LFDGIDPATIWPMRWLLHGNLSVAAADALTRHEQQVRQPGDVGLSPDAAPADVFETARKAQLEIITTDPALANAPFEQKLRFGRTMVLIGVEQGDVEQDDAIDRLFERYKRLSPARLYTVTGSRVKIRQLPGK
jgi:hypothetical protein